MLVRVLSIGVHPGQSPVEARRTRVSNLGALIGVGALTAWTLPLIYLQNWAVLVMQAAATLGYVLVIALNARDQHLWARGVLVVWTYVYITLLSTVIAGSNAMPNMWIVATVPMPYLFFGGERPTTAAALAGAGLLLLGITATDVGLSPPLAPLPELFEQIGRPLNAMAAGISIVVLVGWFARDTARAEADSERLLLNILPGPIADRLKAGESLIADDHPAITVLFADIAGFTPMASKMSAQELVQLLNRLFSEFDALTAAAGLEKVKTIGDAYMVAAGVPEPRDDHAEAIAGLALSMRDVLERFATEKGWDVAVRIGIHSGPAIAGVIGTQKFAYDIWGDTVNTSARMESHGERGRIQMTDTTRQLLPPSFEVERRGDIEVKGKGTVTTWWLEGQAR